MIARRLPALILALTAGLALAACGDDDDGGGVTGARVEVTTVADTAERDGEISLREALEILGGGLAVADLDEGEQARVDGQPGPTSADTITFALADETVIALTEALPALRAGDETIDATGEEVTIDGSALDFVCLELASSDNRLYGLRFSGCRTAVLISAGVVGNIIGGPLEGQGNVLLDGAVGIEINGRQNIVQGNHIGVEPNSSEPRPYEFEAIWLTPQARDNIIGGPGAGEGNVLSGNGLYAISIDGARNNVVQGNFIGLDTTGRIGVPNNAGVNLQAGAFGNLIGGPNEGERNVISGNRQGVLLTGATTTGNTIQGNIFGTSVGQGEDIPNDTDIYEDAGVGENQKIDNDVG
ncbi:MAG: hypothetical protein WD904_10005 [Dehalococcoidia bacterium]